MPATRPWDGGGATNLASEAANWSSNTVPVAGDSVVYDLTSVKDCTWDLGALSFASFDATVYTGTITLNTGTVITTTGAFVWKDNEANVIVCDTPNTATINVGGDVGAPTTAGSGPVLGGVTFNLSGTTGSALGGKANYGYFGNGGTGVGVVNILAGATYACSASGSLKMEIHLYGRLTLTTNNGAGKLGQYLFQHVAGGVAGYDDLYIHLGGVLDDAAGGEAERFLLSFNARIMLMDGTFSAPLVIYSPKSQMRIIPGTYACRDVVFAGGDSAIAQMDYILFDAGGTYNFTGTRNIYTYNQFSSPDFRLILPAGTRLIFAQTVCDLETDGSSSTPTVITWDDNGGEVEFTNMGNFTPPSTHPLQMGKVKFSGGAPVLQNSSLRCNVLTISGGAFNANSKDVAIRDQWTWTAGTISNVAGRTWTLGGSLLFNGGGLSLKPGSTFTVAMINFPDYTANASGVDFQNVTVTNRTLNASNCTNSGSNSGITFSNASRQYITYRHRKVSAPSAGVHMFDMDALVTDGAFRLDGALQFSFSSMTFQQNGTLWGLGEYFNGSVNLVQVDNLDVPLRAVPAAPTGLTIGTNGVWSCRISTSATNYVLKEGTAPGGPYGTTISSDDIISGAIDISTRNGSTRYYVIYASNALGDGANSAEVPVTYPALTLIEDSFAGVDGTSLSGRTPDTTNTPGFTWSLPSGTVVLSGNTANITAGGVGWALIDAGNASVTVVAKITAGTGNSPGVVGRMTNFGNGWGAVFTGSQLKLIQTSGFADTVRDSTGLTISNGDTFGLQFVGNVISLIKNGVVVGTPFTSTFNNTATNCGLRGIGATPKFDSFKVTTP